MFDSHGKVTNPVYSSESKHLLIIFTPNCTACKMQKKSVWNELASKAKAKGYTVRGISLENIQITDAFLRENKFEFDVLVPDAKVFERCYRITKIPQILLIGKFGKVQSIVCGWTLV